MVDGTTRAFRSREVVLTGDRATAPLHLGHYAGSLRPRLALRGQPALYDQTVLIADLQALTEHAGRTRDVRRNVLEVALDFLGVGLDPQRTTIAVQSAVPEFAELTVLNIDLVTVARLERKPTVRAAIELRGFQRNLPAGFLAYPVSQAADITGVRATLVPVGNDQLPMIEQTNESVRRLARLAGRPVLLECRPMISATPRLPGVDGTRASKSFGNAVPLAAAPEEIRARVRALYTDPRHARASDAEAWSAMSYSCTSTPSPRTGTRSLSSRRTTRAGAWATPPSSSDSKACSMRWSHRCGSDGHDSRLTTGRWSTRSAAAASGRGCAPHSPSAPSTSSCRHPPRPPAG